MVLPLLRLINDLLLAPWQNREREADRHVEPRPWRTPDDAPPQFVAQLADRHDNTVTLDVWLAEHVVVGRVVSLEVAASHGQHLGIATLVPKPARNGLLHYQIRDLELPPRSSHLFVMVTSDGHKRTQIVTVMHGLDVEETFAAKRPLRID